jgi:acyl-CoA synthetase (AMP-forming)/AMP-acid ligase II
VVAVFGAAAAGGVFVPVNPLLKPEQVAYILKDCNVRILVTSAERLKLLAPVLNECRDLQTVIVTGGAHEPAAAPNILAWDDALASRAEARPHRVIDTDMAAILYTSGSTGKPKGVVLSHPTAGRGRARRRQYLENREDDRIHPPCRSASTLDSASYTAFHVGASVTLINYLVPRHHPAVAKAHHRAHAVPAVDTACEARMAANARCPALHRHRQPDAQGDIDLLKPRCPKRWRS